MYAVNRYLLRAISLCIMAYCERMFYSLLYTGSCIPSMPSR
jgi:hypothetical protein